MCGRPQISTKKMIHKMCPEPLEKPTAILTKANMFRDCTTASQELSTCIFSSAIELQMEPSYSFLPGNNTADEML